MKTNILLRGNIQDATLEAKVTAHGYEVVLDGPQALFIQCLCEFGELVLQRDTAEQIFPGYRDCRIAVDGLKRKLQRAGFQREQVVQSRYGKGWVLNRKVTFRRLARRAGEGAVGALPIGDFIDCLTTAHQTAPTSRRQSRLQRGTDQAVANLSETLAMTWMKIRQGYEAGLEDDELAHRLRYDREQYEREKLHIELTFQRAGLNSPWEDSYRHIETFNQDGLDVSASKSNFVMSSSVA